MAKTFNFEFLRADMVETEKAFGFMVDSNRLANVRKRERVSYEWLPKSQIKIEEVTFDMYAEAHGEHQARYFFTDGIVWVSVPMWLAAQHNYFKNLGF